MGFQTNISILNDHWDWIQKNPETFVKAIGHGMNDGIDSFLQEKQARRRGVPDGDRYINLHPHETDEERAARVHYVKVHRARHADESQITFSQFNSSYDLDDFIYFGMGEWGQEGVIKGKSNASIYKSEAKRMAKVLREYADRLDKASDNL